MTVHSGDPLDPLDPNARNDDAREAADDAGEAAAPKLLAEGKALVKQRKWTAALTALRASLDTDPQMSEAWLWISVAEYSGWCQAQYEPAVSRVELSAMMPKECAAKANCQLGNLLMTVRKDLADNEEHFREALERDEEYYPMADYHLRCLVKNVREGYADAEERFREAIELDPKYPKAHNNLGRLLATVRGNLPGAERHFREAIRLDPKYAMAHSNLGSLFEARGDAARAEKHYREAIELDEDEELYQRRLTEMKGKIGLADEASQRNAAELLAMFDADAENQPPAKSSGKNARKKAAQRQKKQARSKP